jgi:hypothetical protein
MIVAKRFLAFALAVGALAGCGSTEEPLFPVEGKVQFEGKPLTKGAVILLPDDAKGNNTKHEPRGVIGSDGLYKIATHPRDGAPKGWYKVGVVVTQPSDPKNPYSEPRSLIPVKFGKPAESKLAIEVRPDAPPGAYDLELK